MREKLRGETQGERCEIVGFEKQENEEIWREAEYEQGPIRDFNTDLVHTIETTTSKQSRRSSHQLRRHTINTYSYRSTMATALHVLVTEYSSVKN